MSILTGVNAVIEGQSNVSVLAELIAHIDYEKLVELHPLKKPSITRDQFDRFIGGVGRDLMDVGMLDENLDVTGAYTTSIN